MIPNGHILPTKILAQERKKSDKITKAGILLSAAVTTKDPCITADVKLVGTGTPTIEMSVREGAVVIFSPHSFQRVRVQDEDFMILDIRDVLFFYYPEEN
jgi:co-chaperonin GroES (HSP10)